MLGMISGGTSLVIVINPKQFYFFFFFFFSFSAGGISASGGAGAGGGGMNKVHLLPPMNVIHRTSGNLLVGL